MRFRAKGGPWKPREYAVALNKTPQFVNARIRAGETVALSVGSSNLIPHAAAAAGLGMSIEDAEAAWPACAEEAERRAALEAAKDKRNQPTPRQAPAKPPRRTKAEECAA